MPASLTNQIRLGFSLGWRIWTPNEVGFYAKSLAHSYFIFNILSSKFFDKKLWVVNYSIFVGVRKYYVFIEYLKFGLKTKEERSFWKKVMYITLLTRHIKFGNQIKMEADTNYQKTRAIHRYFSKLEIKTYKTCLDRHLDKYHRFLKGIKKGHTHKVETLEPHVQKVAVSVNKLLFLKSDVNSQKFIKILRLSQPVDLGLKFYNWAELKAKKKLAGVLAVNYGQKVKKMKKNQKIKPTVLTRQIEMRYPVTRPKTKTIMGILESKTKSTKIKVIKRNASAENLKKSFLENRVTRGSEADKIFMHDNNLKRLPENISIREDKLQLYNELILGGRAATRIPNVEMYSFVGGPRMRKYRKLKRSFQSKNIIKYTSLIWFWEKVSKLLCFYVEWTLRYVK